MPGIKCQNYRTYYFTDMGKIITVCSSVIIASIINLSLTEILYADHNNDRIITPGLPCSELELEATEAEPMQPILVHGIPDGYTGELFANIYLADEQVGFAIIEHHNEESWRLITPVHPNFVKEGGKIKLSIEDEFRSCEPFDFTIQEIATITFEPQELLDQFEEIIETFASAHDLTIDELAQLSEEDAEITKIPLIVVSKQLRGMDGYMDLREQFTREKMAPEINDDEWDLLITLYSRSSELSLPVRGIQIDGDESEINNDSQTGYNLEFRQTPELWASSDSDHLIGNRPWNGNTVLSSETASLSICDLIATTQTPEELQVLLYTHSIAKDMLGTFKTYADPASITLSSIAIIAAMAGPSGAPIAVAATATGRLLAVSNYSAKLIEAFLPQALFGFYVIDIEPDYFKEDQDDQSGYWDKAYISAGNREFDVIGESMNLIWSFVGGKALKKLKSSNQYDDTLIRGVDEGNQQLVNSVIGKMIDQMPPDIEKIPACEFGPVEITDKKWTRSSLFDDEEIIRLTGHQTYEILKTGTGFLDICVLDTLFENPIPPIDPDAASCIPDLNRIYPVDVLPIEVSAITVNPPNMRGTVYIEPEQMIDLNGIIKNATDETLGWSIDPAGPHGLTVFGDGSEASVFTSKDRDDYPFTITVESLSFTGLRADPDAPRRYDRIIIDALEEEVELYDCREERPISVNELTPCSFVAYIDGPEHRYRGNPDFPASYCYEGKINRMGMSELGVFIMNWKGKWDGSRLMNVPIIQIIPPDNDQYTYETEGLEFLGGVWIEYEAEFNNLLALYGFATENRNMVMYPLADSNLWVGSFDMEVKMNPGDRNRRDQENNTMEGFFMLGEECMWDFEDEELEND